MIKKAIDFHHIVPNLSYRVETEDGQVFSGSVPLSGSVHVTAPLKDAKLKSVTATAVLP